MVTMYSGQVARRDQLEQLGLLQRGAQQVQHIQQDVQHLRLAQHDTAKRAVLDWASNIDYRGRYSRNLRDLQRDCTEWIHQDAAFQEWYSNDTASKTLWLHGPMGTGKSMLL